MSFHVSKSSVIYVILPYISQIEILLMQGLNRRFYEEYIPIALQNLNEMGGAGLGRLPYMQYARQTFLIVPVADSKQHAFIFDQGWKAYPIL